MWPAISCILHFTKALLFWKVYLGIVAVVECLIALGQGKLATLESRELVSDCRVPDWNRRNMGGGDLPRALAVAAGPGPGSMAWVEISSGFSHLRERETFEQEEEERGRGGAVEGGWPPPPG